MISRSTSVSLYVCVKGIESLTIETRSCAQYPVTIRQFTQMCQTSIARKTEQVCNTWFHKARSFVQHYIARLRSRLTDRLLELVDANARQGTVDSDAEKQDFHTFYMSLTAVGKTYTTMQSALRRIRFEKEMKRVVLRGEEIKVRVEISVMWFEERKEENRREEKLATLQTQNSLVCPNPLLTGKPAVLSLG